MAVYASLEHLNIKDACIRCEIDSAIPEKRGMGSSAAISIAAIRAVFDYYQAELPHDVLEVLVNRAEMIAHMNRVVWMLRPVSVTSLFALLRM